MPFELAVARAARSAIMTAYNRLNGGYCTEHAELLDGHPARRVGLRRASSSPTGSRVGVDRRLGRAPASTSRCPGPAARLRRRRSPTAVRGGDVDEARVDAQVDAAARACSTGSARSTTPPTRRSAAVDRPEHRALARDARRRRRWCCCATTGVLPLDRAALAHAGGDRPQRRPRRRSWAAARPSCAPHYRVSPLDALRARLGDGVDDRPRAGLRASPHAPRSGPSAVGRRAGFASSSSPGTSSPASRSRARPSASTAA